MYRKIYNLTDTITDELITQTPLFGRSKRSAVGCHVTWCGDPTTEIMTHYHVINDNPTTCLYRKEGDLSWEEVDLYASKDYYLKPEKNIQWFKLENLESDQIYETKLKNYDDVYRFKTMPSDIEGKEVRCVLSSDQLNDPQPWIDNVKKGANIMKGFNPDLYMIPGDIVHDDSFRVERWEAFWDGWFKHVESQDGLMIPLIAGLGNHDGVVRNEDGQSASLLWEHAGAKYEDVIYFYSFFSNVDESGYGVTDVSDYLSIIMLNSGHTKKVDGEQKDWLEQKLIERQDGRHILPLLHVSPYPTRYTYNITNTPVRQHWTPLFTQYGVKLVGSGHEHVSMVTKKVTGEQLDENGAVYTGQGISFGSELRDINITDDWYVEFIQDHNEKESDEIRGFDAITFTKDLIKLEKYNLKGDVVYSQDFPNN